MVKIFIFNSGQNRFNPSKAIVMNQKDIAAGEFFINARNTKM